MLISAVALALSLSTAAPGGTWAVVPLEGINVHEGHMAAARQVLKDHLASLGQATVALEAGVGDPASAARSKGATAVLRGTLTRLGQKVKVSLTLEPLDGASRNAGLDAGSPEDLDPVLMRLARYFVNGEPLAEARVSEVTEEESDAFKRKRANSYFGVVLTGMPARSSGSDAFLAGANVYWLYDARTFMADIEAGFASGQGSSNGAWGGVTVGMLYPLLDRDVTPFVGGGVGYGRLEIGGFSGSGLQIFADAGVIYGRTSSVHFRADVRPFLTTYQLSNWMSSGSVGYGAQAAVGVGF